jgi:hypothetical protein
MLDIDRSSHLMSPRPTIDSDSVENDEGTDALAEVIKGKSMKTSQKGANSPGGDLLPSHPKKPRVTTRKCRASALPGGDDEETPM